MTVSPFGARLRQWRRHRGLSQLALAGRVGSTPRHLSFLETGRSRPSRQMVLRLGAALDMPLREANQLLQAAGLPPAHPEADVQAPALEPFRRAMDRLLAAHEPFPALVLDAHARVVAANQASSTLFGGGLVGSNLVERYLADPAVRAAVVNWPEIAWPALDRLRRQVEGRLSTASCAGLSPWQRRPWSGCRGRWGPSMAWSPARGSAWAGP